MYDDPELGWDPATEWHPLFRMYLTDPTSFKSVDVMGYAEYWAHQAELAGLGDDEAWRGRGLP
jgi:uncharacterized protein YfeS